MTDSALYADLFRQAQDVLVLEWAKTFTFIVGTGSAVPWLVRRVRKAETPLLRRACSLGAVLLCIASVPLAVDTYFVESRDSRAFVTRDCSEPLLEPRCEGDAAGLQFELARSGKFVHLEPR